MNSHIVSDVIAVIVGHLLLVAPEALCFYVVFRIFVACHDEF